MCFVESIYHSSLALHLSLVPSIDRLPLLAQIEGRGVVLGMFGDVREDMIQILQVFILTNRLSTYSVTRTHHSDLCHGT